MHKFPHYFRVGVPAAIEALMAGAFKKGLAFADETAAQSFPEACVTRVP